MPKSFLSDDPFAAALDDQRRNRRPASTLLLAVPLLGLTLLGFGMHVHPSTGVSILAMDPREKTSRSERRAGQLAGLAQARGNVLYWQRENCCGTTTPHSRAKLRMWERGYHNRLVLFARMYGKPVPRTPPEPH